MSLGTGRCLKTTRILDDRLQAATLQNNGTHPLLRIGKALGGRACLILWFDTVGQLISKRLPWQMLASAGKG